MSLNIMADRKKYTVEFMFNARPQLVYNFIGTPAGLNVWFADDVSINEDVLTFTWEGSSEKARIVTKKFNKFIKLRWVDRPKEEYLIFEIIPDELTGELALMITDYDNEDEIEDAKLVWHASIEKLRETIGG
jgi:hypothetical protein